MQKRLLFLGGSYFQIPPLIYAKSQGYYIITCDYLPDNPGHKYADEYHNISTTDVESVLQLALKLKIDGIIPYGSDPSAVTAAFIAEALGLPGNPYKSVCILSRKDLYRDFLQKNNFNVPWAKTFSSFSETEAFISSVTTPVVIKPVDSSGSKGVAVIHSIDQLQAAYDNALYYSRIKKILVEEYIQRKGYQIAGDGFVLNGKLVFRCFAQEHFIEGGNPCAPIGESFPLGLPETIQRNIHDEVERLMTLLEMRVGGINFDIMLNEKEEVYLMEIAGRSGGNLITEIIKYSTGTDLVKYVVDGALGIDCSGLTMYTNADFYSIYILNSPVEGLFKGIETDASLSENIIEERLFMKQGMPVEQYQNSSGSLGCLILTFSSFAEMLEKMDSMSQRVRIRLM